MSQKLDPKIEQKIAEYLKDHTQGETYRKFKVGKGTISRIAQKVPEQQALGRLSGRTSTKNATEARKTYAKADRLEVLKKLMGKIDDSLNGILKPSDLRSIAIALGTTIDKFRLEEAEEEDEHSGIDDLMEEIKREAEAYMPPA